MTDLRALAKAATPELWYLFAENNTFSVSDSKHHTDSIVHWSGFDASNQSTKKQRANAVYIAFMSPERAGDAGCDRRGEGVFQFGHRGDSLCRTSRFRRRSRPFGGDAMSFRESAAWKGTETGDEYAPIGRNADTHWSLNSCGLATGIESGSRRPYPLCIAGVASGHYL